MLKVNILKAEVSDAKLLHEADSKIFSDSWSVKSFESSIKSEMEIVLKAETEDTGVFAGYISVSFVLDEANINRIAVLPEYRGNHIGNMLLEKTEAYFKDRIKIYNLEVRASNEPAIHMYMSNGYETVGRRRKFYHKPEEDAVLMTKRKE